MYVVLGESRGTLSIFTERGFEELALRMETEFMQGPESKRFELQFYGNTCRVELDKQGRLVLPERLRAKAKLGESVVLLGQKFHVDVWGRDALDKAMGIDWEGDDWPDWQGFLRAKPSDA